LLQNKILDGLLIKNFTCPIEVAKLFADRKVELKKKYDEWKTEYVNGKRKMPIKWVNMKVFKPMASGNLEEELLAAAPREPNATRNDIELNNSEDCSDCSERCWRLGRFGAIN
jgi:hypothetical protein